ncbi:hypothetical protein [Vibrio barjaei]|uniref:hypothetical protein n=1 Tax=Vibrio barjaei TaxID=1676683 RepID=UPI0022851304|nr:hypothetical protein [Vibrio barjaei]MCY9872941.1 hypothetical protein [Vibrio barjaei]
MQNQYIDLNMKYADHNGNVKFMRIRILNDIDLNGGQMVAMFKEHIDSFHAAKYGLPSPAEKEYSWEGDGNDHHCVEIVDLETFEVYPGQNPHQFTDELCKEPISAVKRYMEKGGKPDFLKAEREALVAERDRLNALIGKEERQLVIVLDGEKVESLIVNEENANYEAFILQKQFEHFDKEVCNDWHGDRKKVSAIRSYVNKKAVAFGEVMHRIPKQRLYYTRFSIDGNQVVATERMLGEERLTIPRDLSADDVEEFVSLQNSYWL